MYTALCSNSTVDRENFAVKIISRLWPTRKKKNLRGDDQWIGACKSTPPPPPPRGKCQNDDYIQPAIPGSPDTW